MNALSDLKAVELSLGHAAAFAGRLCADAGAETLLLEPRQGHPLRHEGPFQGEVPDPETSAAHLNVNAGKRSVVIDIESQATAAIELIAGADIFLTDIPRSVLDPIGLGWDSLHGRVPSLLMTRITPFGDTGPYADYAGSNLVSLALGGQLKITGDPGRPPLSNFGAQAEYQGGLSAFAGTVANLLLRDASGEGAYLDLSIQDVVATNLEQRGTSFNLGVVANRAGLTVSATYGVYPCADGWVYLTAFAPALWDRLKAVVQLDRLDDERFATQAVRLENNDELQAVLTEWTLSKSSAELREFALQGHPLTVAEDEESLLASQQWRDRGYVNDIDHPAAGAHSVLGSPWRTGEPVDVKPAPTLGDSNDLLEGPA
jgi:crotonobetainyl-CoA:carnitine CoA-transferase CaiB-like acyl-CoA transferase